MEDIAQRLSAQLGFDYSLGVMPITVAALMTPKWLARHLQPPPEATHVILPGYLESGRDEVQEFSKIPVFCGPKDCRALPEWLGQTCPDTALEDYAIEIIAEINHAPRFSVAEVLKHAQQLRQQGADVVDLGCDPNARCALIGDYVASLVDAGIRVSIDTFDAWEAAQATRRGAELVLSVNSSNRAAAVDWGAEVVAIPDTPDDQKSLHETVDFLSRKGVSLRIDPILEPLGTGLTSSVLRYARTRERYPDAAMLMGIGNVTELSDVDSAGINLLLLGICAELTIDSVLTTQVINWSRSAVQECDIARRLVHYACRHGVPPKRISDQLVMLRDPKLRPYPASVLESLAESIRDNNYRIFAQDDRVHVISAGLHLADADPFRLFDELLSQSASDNIDRSHAFYLGFEFAKASIALTLGKQYEQDQALQWGFLTRPENHHRLARTSRFRDPDR